MRATDAIANVLALAVWLLTFLAVWRYCAVNFGALVGQGLGWSPAVVLYSVTALLAKHLWGRAVLGLAVLFALPGGASAQTPQIVSSLGEAASSSAEDA